MALYKTSFGKLQQRDTHCRERSMPHFSALSNRASASAPFTPHHRGHDIPTSTIFTDLHHQQTIKPDLLEIHVQPQEYPLYWLLNSQGVTKTKRVSDPLNKAVRESLCGNSTDHVDRLQRETPYSTSGSDHILSVAPGFLEEQEENGECSSCPRPEDCESDAESSGVNNFNPVLDEQIREILQAVSCSCTRQEQMLIRDVTEALRKVKQKAELKTDNEEKKSFLCRFVMSSLRCAGYNAGICKSRWEKTNGYPAGDYQFIDVVMEESRSMAKGGDRFLVDIDFRAQFQIARPTKEYDELAEVLPVLFVGRADKVRHMVRIMCDAARRSFESEGMHIPPWRKLRYMQAKWLGPYKRTTNPISTSHRRGEYEPWLPSNAWEWAWDGTPL